MDFAWSNEQLDMRDAIIKFARSELNDQLIERDRNEEFSWEAWRKCAEFGIQGLPAPVEFGGGGSDILTTVCALEALGYGCRDNGLLFSINAHTCSSFIPPMFFATQKQTTRNHPHPIPH